MNAQHAVVSSDEEPLILVDESDRETGHLTKLECHQGDGLLHRAFSVFLFNGKGEVILQRRSADKMLWGGFWSNTCCSHPRQGEEVAEAATRRVREELGLDVELSFLYKFIYKARFEDVGTEHEYCWVLAGLTDEEPRPNANEISGLKNLAPDDLDRELAESPDAYTPWLQLEWPRIRNDFLADLLPK